MRSLPVFAALLLVGCVRSVPEYKLSGVTLSEGDEASRVAIERSLIAQVKPSLDKPLRLIAFELPPYPRELRGPNANGGKVAVNFKIGSNGDVRDTSIVGSPDRYLAGLVLMSLLNWRFEPITRDGKPVEIPLRYEFVFRLR